MKPCPHCGSPIENAVETCPACGGTVSSPVGVRPGPEAADLRERWSDRERKTWLLGELRAALAVISGNALKGIVFAVVGGLIGFLVGDLKGLATGAVVALIVGLVLF